MALASLAAKTALKKASSFFETEPVGYPDQPWFINLALEIDTSLNPEELLDLCQEIEESCGRIRTFPNAPRTLDLDILLFGERVIREDRLVIPHPRLAERRFVLEPLAQIAPEVMHPVLRKSIGALLDACTDHSKVRRLADA